MNTTDKSEVQNNECNIGRILNLEECVIRDGWFVVCKKCERARVGHHLIDGSLMNFAKKVYKEGWRVFLGGKGEKYVFCKDCIEKAEQMIKKTRETNHEYVPEVQD